MSNNQPPQGFVPSQGQLARKRSKLLGCFVIVMAVIAVIIAVVVVVAVASSGGEDVSVPIDRGQPRPVAVGTEFTIGKHRLDTGWKLEYQEYLGTKVTGTVTNVSKSTSTAIFHIKFLKGSVVVGNMSCVSNDLEPNQQEAVECLNTVSGAANLLRKGSYDKVTAEATF